MARASEDKTCKPLITDVTKAAKEQRKSIMYKHIVIIAGSNDLKTMRGPWEVRQVEDRYRSMLETSKHSHPNSTIHVAEILPRENIHPNRIHKFNRFVHTIADKLDVHVLPSYAGFISGDRRLDYFQSDRVHNTKGLSVLASIIINHLRGGQLHNRPGHRDTALMQTRQRRERYDYAPSKAHRGTKSNKFHLAQIHLPIHQEQHTPFAHAVHQPTQYVGQQQTPPLQVPMSIQPFANAAHQPTQYVGPQQTPPLQVPMSVKPFANAAQQPTQYVGPQQTPPLQVPMSVKPFANAAQQPTQYVG